ncbi:MAG: histidine phosphatase family protein [Gammaproteobacteria bacterium]|nr:hypothetical protein [Xanthomonadales bacterium]
MNQRGKNSAPIMGQRLSKKSIQPQIVLCSTAARAQATAQKVLDQIPQKYEIQFLKDLYHAYPDEILNIVSKVSDNYQNIMIVGHNPGLTELANDLMGEYHFPNIPTAGLVTFELDIDSWSAIVDMPNPAILLDYDYPKKSK